MAHISFTMTGTLPFGSKQEFADFMDGITLYTDDIIEANPRGFIRLSARITTEGQSKDLERELKGKLLK